MEKQEIPCSIIQGYIEFLSAEVKRECRAMSKANTPEEKRYHAGLTKGYSDAIEYMQDQMALYRTCCSKN